jgi:hypothetical protein
VRRKIFSVSHEAAVGLWRSQLHVRLCTVYECTRDQIDVVTGERCCPVSTLGGKGLEICESVCVDACLCVRVCVVLCSYMYVCV